MSASLIIIFFPVQSQEKAVQRYHDLYELKGYEDQDIPPRKIWGDGTYPAVVGLFFLADWAMRESGIKAKGAERKMLSLAMAKLREGIRQYNTWEP